MATSTVPGDTQIVNLGGAFTPGNGPFLITAVTSGTAHTLHTATAGTDNVDVVTIWAQCVDTSSSFLITIDVDGVEIGPMVAPRQSAPFIVLPGLALNAGVVVKAYADTASKVVVMAKVVRMVAATA